MVSAGISWRVGGKGGRTVLRLGGGTKGGTEMTKVGCYHKRTFQMFWITCCVFRLQDGMGEMYHYRNYYTEVGGGPFRTLPASEFTFVVRGV